MVVQIKKPIREAEIRVLHCSNTLYSPKYGYHAEVFDLESLFPILNQLISGFLPRFSSQCFGGFSPQ